MILGYGNLRLPGQLGGYGKRPPAEEAAAWVPDDLGTDLVSSWDAWESSRVTLNGGDVAALVDLRGVADLAHGVSTQQPLLSSALWNGQDVAVFDKATTDRLGVGATTAYNQVAGSVSYGIFLVGAKDYVSGVEYLFSHYLTGNCLIEAFPASATNLTLHIKLNTTLITRNLTIADDTPFALYVGIQTNSGDATKADYKVYLNGAADVDLSNQAYNLPTAAHSSTSFGYRRASSGLYCNSHLAHMAVTKFLSAEQLTEYFAWANTKFGLGY